MSEFALIVPLALLAALGAFFLGRARGFMQGYALGCEVADQMEGSGQTVGRRLPGAE